MFAPLPTLIITTLLLLSVDNSYSVKFGEGRPVHDLPEINGFRSGPDFYKNFVDINQAVVMRGATTSYPSHTLWQNDEYFLTFNESKKLKVYVEMEKKQRDDRPYKFKSFKQFVSTYNDSQQYLVYSLTNLPFIAKDVILPLPLQCPKIEKGGMDEVSLWFSSGGTISTGHIDAVQNIICIIRGKKSFVMVDPETHNSRNIIDHLGTLMADVDDMEKSDKYEVMMEEIKYFYNVTLSAGDCLYIPYRWIHQVRSPGNNIGVTFWWYPHLPIGDGDKCNAQLDHKVTVDSIRLGSDNYDDIILDDCQEKMKELVEFYDKPVPFEDFREFFGQRFRGWQTKSIDHLPGAVDERLKWRFAMLDLDDSGFLEEEEVLNVKRNEKETACAMHYEMEMIIARINYNESKKTMKEEL